MIEIIGNPVIKKYGGKNRRMVSAKCECGKIINVPFSPSLKYPNSCGCKNIKYEDRTKLKKMKSSFEAMHKRCNDESGKHYKYYKANGISVCKRWHKFSSFYEDMQSTWFLGAQLDRFPNNTGHYEPNNVRWATTKQQQRNKPGLLSEDNISFIRNSKELQSSLAIKFNVNQGTISRIKNNKRWT